MAECIICREEKTSFSDEHVIPDALGGYYHIYSVCTQCNSDLGSFVDSKLVNHSFSEFQRYLLGLKGKSKKLPNPFSGTHQMEGDENSKVQLRLNEDGKPTPYKIPSVTYAENSDKNGSITVSVTLDATDEHEFDGILKKISKKLQVPIEELQKAEKSFVSIHQPSIHLKLSIDLKEFKIGLLKIAYEFAVDSLPEYFADESSREIAKILKNAEYDAAESHVNIGSGFEHELFASMSDYLDLDSKRHFLVLTSSISEGLLCFVHLHGMFSVGVTLSHKSYPSELMVFGVNDIDRKIFRKVYPEQLLSEIYAPPELRFQYYFSNEREMKEFLMLQEGEGFSFHAEDGTPSLFDRAGNRLEYDLYQKMKQMEMVVISEPLESGGLAHTFPIDGEVYIKIMPSEKLVRIVAVSEEFQQVAKL